jgi:Cu/Ag efflux pump CusA
VQFKGRGLARAAGDAQKAVQQAVVLPQGYTLDWTGEYSEYVETVVGQLIASARRITADA